MPLQKLEIPGGIVKDRSAYAVGGRWIDADKVRFQQGFPEPIGGWFQEGNWTATGTPSNLRAWSDLTGNQLIAIGTEQKLQLVYNDTIYDITPIRETQSLTGPFTTVDDSAVVTVADTGHGAEDGDAVIFSGASAAGGITIDGEYTLTYVDDNTYTITHSSAATSAATGGGSVTAKYLLSVGSSTSVHGFSNGDIVRITEVVGMTQLNGNYYTVANVATNTFELSGTNTSGYGSYSSAGKATEQFGWGVAASASSETVTLEPSQWSFSLWGEDLIATRRDGGTFVWDATNGPSTRAVVLTNAPTNALLSLVSVPDRHVVCFGADDDPLNVKWSSQEANTTWSATDTNTAGSQRLEIGHKIISAIQTRDQILIFTDDAVFGMQFQGPPYTFGFRALATSCPPIGQNAAIEINGIVYWMGCGHFHTFSGRVQEMPCPVRDHVFNNINKDKENLSFGGLNRKFTELWWFYPTVDTGALDKYVIYNYTTKEWSIGSLSRQVWIDDQDWLTYPTAVDSSGTVFYHENGNSDNGSDMTSYVECGAIEITDGARMLLLDKFIPDVDGSPQVTVFTKKYNNSSEVTKGPFDLSSSVEKVSMRAKGRQIRFKVSNTSRDYWRFGNSRFQVTVDGTR
jgi:hypothetical protein